jgi:DNA polymerase (family 10)
LTCPINIAEWQRKRAQLFTIDSGAHSAFDYDNLTYGMSQARRGWLEASDVLNALPLPKLITFLGHRRRSKAARATA